MKPFGYLVMEASDDFEQALVLRRGEGLPKLGILDWSVHKRQEPRAVFATRQQALDAITRTEHYRLAFGESQHPAKAYCRVVPVEFLDSELP